MRVLLLTENPDRKMFDAIKNVQEWYAQELDYPHLNMTAEYKSMDKLEWVDVNGEYLRKKLAWHKVMPTLRDNNDYDIVAYVIPEKYWPKENNANGYASTQNFLGTHFFTVRDSGQPREKNKDWANDDQVSGTLRHELMHVFHHMLGLFGKLDKTHEYDIEANKLNEIGEYIDLYKIKPKGFEKCEDWNLKSCMKANKRGIITQFINEPVSDTRLATILDRVGLLDNPKQS